MASESQTRWEARYQEGDVPWDLGAVEPQLEAVLHTHKIAPRRAIEVGCGTGTNSVWLAERGFTVTAIDLSQTAIDQAAARAKKAGVTACTFQVCDFLTDEIPDNSFDLAFDRGCFHSFGEVEVRRSFAKKLAGLLASDGVWLSLIGSTDGPPREEGPPRRSAREIVEAVEEFFEVVELIATKFVTTRDAPTPDSWACLLRKRRVY